MIEQTVDNALTGNEAAAAALEMMRATREKLRAEALAREEEQFIADERRRAATIVTQVTIVCRANAAAPPRPPGTSQRRTRTTAPGLSPSMRRRKARFFLARTL